MLIITSKTLSYRYMGNELSIQPTEAALCGSCYAKVNDADAFCDKCGFPLKGTEEEQQNFINDRTTKEIDLEDYNKKIKTAGTALYWIAAVCALSGLILYGTGPQEQKIPLLVINLILALLFVGLGAWSRKKPFAAIISGAALYAIILVVNAIDNPLSIVQGIIMKIFIIGAFIKGIKSAIEADKVKKELNID